MSWPNKRLRQGSLQTEHQYSEPTCPRCLDRKMASQYPPRPRLTRLDTKTRSAPSASSASTSSSESPPPTMTDLAPSPFHPKEEAGPPSCATLSRDMEETLNLQDLELIMYWCTTTYRSMARDHTAEPLWQTVIPQLSLQFPSLRHGLLGLSALQLAGATTSTGRKWQYLDSARKHQAHALAGIRLDGVQDLTTAQCNASFALCCVLLVFSYAYCLIDDEEKDDEEKEGKEQPDILDEFHEVFELTRWLVSAMMMTIDRVAAGELSPLVRPKVIRPTMPDMSQLVVSSLRRRNAFEAQRDPAHEKEVYDQAIEHLRSSLEQLMNGGEPKDFAFCWAFRVPVRYQDLVRERKPFALVVLAHYAVILHHLRDSWWMADWGIRILRAIDNCLEPGSRHLISWPIDATGGCFPIEE